MFVSSMTKKSSFPCLNSSPLDSVLSEPIRFETSFTNKLTSHYAPRRSTCGKDEEKKLEPNVVFYRFRHRKFFDQGDQRFFEKNLSIECGDKIKIFFSSLRFFLGENLSTNIESELQAKENQEKPMSTRSRNFNSNEHFSPKIHPNVKRRIFNNSVPTQTPSLFIQTNSFSNENLSPVNKIDSILEELSQCQVETRD